VARWPRPLSRHAGARDGLRWGPRDRHRDPCAASTPGPRVPPGRRPSVPTSAAVPNAPEPVAETRSWGTAPPAHPAPGNSGAPSRALNDIPLDRTRRSRRPRRGRRTWPAKWPSSKRARLALGRGDARAALPRSTHGSTVCSGLPRTGIGAASRARPWSVWATSRGRAPSRVRFLSRQPASVRGQMRALVGSEIP